MDFVVIEEKMQSVVIEEKILQLHHPLDISDTFSTISSYFYENSHNVMRQKSKLMWIKTNINFIDIKVKMFGEYSRNVIKWNIESLIVKWGVKWGQDHFQTTPIFLQYMFLCLPPLWSDCNNEAYSKVHPSGSVPAAGFGWRNGQYWQFGLI